MRLFTLLNVVDSSTGSNSFQLVKIIIIFIVIFFGAYYTSRFLGSYQGKRTKDANLKVVEAISVGPQKTIQLVKVGSEFVMIGVTKDKITFLKEISKEQMDVNLFQNSSLDVVPFRTYFDRFIKNKNAHNNDKK